MSRELETFLRCQPDLVLVNFWQEGCEASRYMAQMLATLEEFQRVPVLHLRLDEHRRGRAATAFSAPPRWWRTAAAGRCFALSGGLRPKN